MEQKAKPKSYFRLFFEYIFSTLKIAKESCYNNKGKLKVEIQQKLLEIFFIYSLLFFVGAAAYSLYNYRSPHFMKGLFICFAFGIFLILIQKGFSLLFHKLKIEKLRFLSATILIILGGLLGRSLLIL